MIIIDKTVYFYCTSSQKPDGIYSIAITSFPFVKSAFTLRVLCGLWYIRNQREMCIIIISCNHLCVCAGIVKYFLGNMLLKTFLTAHYKMKILSQQVLLVFPLCHKHFCVQLHLIDLPNTAHPDFKHTLALK